MAFPTIAATNTSSQVSGGTTITVNLPASIAAGNLLLMLINTPQSTSLTTPSGWTLRAQIIDGIRSTWVFTKIATGSEGATQAVTADADVDSAHATARITGHSATTAPEISTTVGGPSSTPDPPNRNASWGAEDNLWIALTGCQNSAADLTAPTNYTGLVESLVGGTNEVAFASRQLNAASEDPGTFANANADAWGTGTLVIRPASQAAVKTKYYKQRRAA